LGERDEINRFLIADPATSWACIGRELERHPTTVMREVVANGGRDCYRPATADRAAQAARRRPRERLVSLSEPTRARIVSELGEGRSPMAVVLDLEADRIVPRPCVETLYAAIFDGSLGLKATETLRTRRRRRRPRQQRHHNRRPALPNIGDRPKKANERAEPGHWEADQIIGARNQSSMIILCERQSRFSIPVTMPCGYTATEALAGLVEACEQIPGHLLKSITFDQGSEWAKWETLSATYGLTCWFCEPHSPWQRGQIENTNRQYRFWFPRGTDLSRVTPSEARNAARIINGQRRRALDKQSPAALYDALTVQ